MNQAAFKFHTIVVATDLSDNASAALRQAQAIAHQHGASLVLVHVIDPLAYAFPHGAPAWPAFDRAARNELAQIEEEVRAQGIAVHSVVETGIICERILQAVSDHHADLLVLGTRASSEAGRAALGTVARQLLARATCPILTVSGKASSNRTPAGHWRRVLVATDFSQSSLSALNLAQRVTQSHLLALHVSSAAKKNPCSQCLERLRFLAPFNESHTIPIEHVVAPGNSAEVIAASAQEFHADLVVLGSPAQELSEEELPTSTVLGVVSRVTCPVLCVPAIQQMQLVESIREATVAC
jgi:nucleotide-binding universal stress UspA family protein